MGLSFGTDGVRGVAFEELTEVFVQRLGRAAGDTLGAGRWLIGRDTRESGPRLTAALAAGLHAAGGQVVDLGVMPTPGVAHTAAAEASLGAMISASHNPWTDNGVKLFGEGGQKLTDDQQQAVQRALDDAVAANGPLATPLTPEPHPDPLAAYRDSRIAALDGRDLAGVSVVLDCAHGAASPVAGPLFEALGARVEVLNDLPDGRNINHRCGSTHPDGLQRAVVAAGADLGLAFDGDADRLIGVDDRGELIDGDRLMALFAIDLRERGELVDDTLVITVMSNLGLRRAMADAGVRLLETPVGDRAVLEALDAGRLTLGGEQSGHLIFRHLATTGDGILSGLLFADLLRRSGVTSHELSSGVMTTYPQVLINIRVAERPIDVELQLRDEIERVAAALGSEGRVLVRPSGTEPLIRVMVEAVEPGRARSAAEELASVVERRFG